MGFPFAGDLHPLGSRKYLVHFLYEEFPMVARFLFLLGLLRRLLILAEPFPRRSNLPPSPRQLVPGAWRRSFCFDISGE